MTVFRTLFTGVTLSCLVLASALARKGLKAKNELVKAASEADLGKVKELLDAGADIDATDVGGGTALMAAARRNNPRHNGSPSWFSLTS